MAKSTLSKSKASELLVMLEDFTEHHYFTDGVLAFLKSDDEADKLIEYMKTTPDLSSSDILVYVLLLQREREHNTTEES